jgi:tripartite-type tricarboxylate transporter receptor subunit TctC
MAEMMNLSIAVARKLAVSLMMAIAGSATAQQAYPSKPIRLVVPYAPGGNTSVLARLFVQKLTESWGQPVIVDNRPGGNTIIGTEAVAKAPADGYTILLVTSSHVINPLLLASLPYDAVKDFAPVATLAGSEYILVVHPSVPAGTLREFVALARSRPGQLNYATAGSGGINHLVAEWFSNIHGVKLQHIPYKGGGLAVTDLIGGQVQLSFQNTPAVVSHINTGKLRAIAISGEARSPALPQVPTFTEAGMRGFDVKIWFGILTRAGTAQAVIDKLAGEFARILGMPDIRDRLASLGVDPFIGTPKQFAALMQTEVVRYAGIIKSANIRLEN